MVRTAVDTMTGCRTPEIVGRLMDALIATNEQLHGARTRRTAAHLITALSSGQNVDAQVDVLRHSIEDDAGHMGDLSRAYTINVGNLSTLHEISERIGNCAVCGGFPNNMPNDGSQCPVALEAINLLAAPVEPLPSEG